MNLPISSAIKVNDTVYTGGIAPFNENNEIVAKGNIEVQTEAVINRMEQCLRKCGMGLKNLIFVNVFLSDMKLYDAMNEIYGKMLPEPYPARKVIETNLSIDGMVVEMTGIATLNEKEPIILDDRSGGK